MSAAASAPWDRRRIFDLLIEAGKIALGHRADLKREVKPDRSIVTQSDREIEALFTRELESPREGVYLIGEETVEEKGEDYIQDALRGVAYVIDPIDGTAPYAHGLPHWGISIGRMEAGRVTDGAVFFPEIRDGEMVLSEGTAVIQGLFRQGSWNWSELEPPAGEWRATLIAITQDIAKRGRVSFRNPVQALGSAVLPLVGILQGRFLAYLGKLKLWDLAGCLPLLHRHRLSVTHLNEEPPRPLELAVDPGHYDLDPAHPFRWGVKGGLLVCPPAEAERLRRALKK